MTCFYTWRARALRCWQSMRSTRRWTRPALAGFCGCSRVSFLAVSPQVRRLLDRSSAISEQLVEQMYANGVDPERMPHVNVLRLTDTTSTTQDTAEQVCVADIGVALPPTPLERRLHQV